MPAHRRDSSAPGCAHRDFETIGCELAAEVLRRSGQLRFRATGASMLPSVWPGDILLVHRDEPRNAHPGDIILFAREGRLFAHRVTEVRSPKSGVRGSEIRIPNPESRLQNPESPIEFVTRGDALSANDPPVSSQEFLGRIVAVEHGTAHHTPLQSPVSKVISWILSRSEFITRVVLGVRHRALESRDSGLGIRDTG
jgi:hypothetical protein